jgi:hypothetical protein
MELRNAECFGFYGTEELICFEGLYQLPDENSVEIETCSNIVSLIKLSCV